MKYQQSILILLTIVFLISSCDNPLNPPETSYCDLCSTSLENLFKLEDEDSSNSLDLFIRECKNLGGEELSGTSIAKISGWLDEASARPEAPEWEKKEFSKSLSWTDGCNFDNLDEFLQMPYPNRFKVIVDGDPECDLGLAFQLTPDPNAEYDHSATTWITVWRGINNPLDGSNNNYGCSNPLKQNWYLAPHLFVCETFHIACNNDCEAEYSVSLIQNEPLQIKFNGRDQEKLREIHIKLVQIDEENKVYIYEISGKNW